MEHVLVILKADGSEIGRRNLPLETGPEEVFRRLRVGDDGGLYLLLTDMEGVKLVKVALQGGGSPPVSAGN